MNRLIEKTVDPDGNVTVQILNERGALETLKATASEVWMLDNELIIRGVIQ